MISDRTQRARHLQPSVGKITCTGFGISECAFFTNPSPFFHQLKSSFMRRPIPDSVSIARLGIRMGCVLGYHARESTPILFLLRPRPERTQIVIKDDFLPFSGMPVRSLTDPHGNEVLWTMLVPGYNEFRHEAVCLVHNFPDNHRLPSAAGPVDQLPLDVLRYTYPSRYCESDKLHSFAWQRFGCLPNGLERVQAICDWVHTHIEYRSGSGSPHASAWEVMQRGFGVCRDFAHVMIALCRALDLPARYVAGHIPRLANGNYGADSDIGIDFHAYAEVYLGGCWHTFDARHNRPLTGRIKTAHGMDAVDAAIATFYGNVEPVRFEVWSSQFHVPLPHISEPDGCHNKVDHELASTMTGTTKL
jgi:transglutaminase-like putative cysteine protease